MHGAQPRNRGEQAERAATRRNEQGGVSRRQLPNVVAPNIGDHKDPRLCRVIERRGDPSGVRAHRQVPQTGAGLGAAPRLFGIGCIIR